MLWNTLLKTQEKCSFHVEHVPVNVHTSFFFFKFSIKLKDTVEYIYCICL